MTDYASTRNEGFFPRGWQHLALQFAIWLGFYGVYQVARGAADRGVGQAFWNGTLVIEFENRFGLLFEPAVQRLVEGSNFLISATTLTYWLSQFAVVGVTLLWVYFRHHEVFTPFRNWLIAANLLGLVGYIAMPTAPPRLFPEWSFIDTLAEHSSVDQSSVGGAVSEPVRRDAEPSCDRRADRGDRDVRPLQDMAGSTRVARLAGVGLVLGHGDRKPLLARLRSRVPARDRHRIRPLPRTIPNPPLARRRPVSDPDERPDQVRVNQLDRVKQEYTAAAREILQRSMRGVARTKLTPDMLTLAGVLLCLAGAVLVGFQDRNEYLFYWLGGVLFVVGSIADILDGALARAASKGTVFGAFLDSTLDRVGEAAMLAAIGIAFHHDDNMLAFGDGDRRGDRLVSRGATRGRRRRRSGCAATWASGRASSGWRSSPSASRSHRGATSNGRSTRWRRSPG